MTTKYLIEYAIDGKPFTGLMTADELSAHLSKNIAYAHHSDIPFEVLHLARYDSGALTPLHMISPEGHSVDDNDYLHYPYEVWPVDGAATAELTFTVTIDGRV